MEVIIQILKLVKLKQSYHFGTYLTIFSLGTGNGRRKCTLKGTWFDTAIRQGDIVNVLGLDEEVNKDWVIDDMNGLLVVNPDVLISGTSIVSTLFCMRKAVLNERFKVRIASFYNGKGFSFPKILSTFFLFFSGTRRLFEINANRNFSP